MRYFDENHLSSPYWQFKPRVHSKDGVDYCHVVYPLGKPEDTRSCVTKGSQSAKELWRTASPLDALALEPSDSCNDGVKPGASGYR